MYSRSTLPLESAVLPATISIARLPSLPLTFIVTTKCGMQLSRERLPFIGLHELAALGSIDRMHVGRKKLWKTVTESLRGELRIG